MGDVLVWDLRALRKHFTLQHMAKHDPIAAANLKAIEKFFYDTFMQHALESIQQDAHICRANITVCPNPQRHDQLLVKFPRVAQGVHTMVVMLHSGGVNPESHCYTTTALPDTNSIEATMGAMVVDGYAEGCHFVPSAHELAPEILRVYKKLYQPEYNRKKRMRRRMAAMRHVVKNS